MKIARALKIYEANEKPIYVHTASSKAVLAFRNLYLEIRGISRDMQDNALEKVISLAASANYEFMFNPTPYRANENLLSLIRELNQAIEKIAGSVQSNLAGKMLDMSNYCEHIIEGDDNQLFAIFKEMSKFDSTETILIVVKTGRIKRSFEAYLETTAEGRNTKIVLSGEIASVVENYGKSYVFGDPDAYEGVVRIFASIATPKISVIAYSTRIEKVPSLFGSLAQLRAERKFIMKSPVKVENSMTLLKDEIEKIQGRISSNLVEATIRSHSFNAEGTISEFVDCFVFVMSGNSLFCIPTPQIEDSRVLVEVLDPSEETGHRVQRVDVNEITANSIILTRKGHTSTSAIIPLANEIMGNSSQRNRENQAKWKERLVLAAREHGMEKLKRELMLEGIANPYIKGWSKIDGMRPKKDDVFRKLLGYLRFNPQEITEIFESARVLNSAHIAAGHEFLRRLKVAFEDVEISAIFSDGFLDKNITADGAVATLSAVVCLSRLEQTTMVPDDMVRKLIPMDERHLDGKNYS